MLKKTDPKLFSLSLRLRIILTNFMVMLVTLTVATSVAYVYKAETFEREIVQSGEAQELELNLILTAFNRINNRGTQLSFFVSLVSVGLITFSLTESINRPLKQMEKAISQINTGDFEAPSTGIAEFNRLSGALNTAASRIQTAEEVRRKSLGDLAHELNSPLSVIRGYLELVDQGKMNLTPTVGHQLREEAERMARLIADLSVLAKAEAGTLVLRWESVEPVKVLTTLIQGFCVKNQKNVQIRFECPESLPEVWVDPDRFRQIVVNLLSNAMHYTQEGTISVRAGTQAEVFWVEVCDTGIGISRKDLPYIFDRFWRSEDSRQRNKEGSGIGLSITKWLIEALGGSIAVDSQLGLGTTFRITLPHSKTNHISLSKI